MLTHLPSTTWHACPVCGHAYPPALRHACPSYTPSHGMLAYPALLHMACLPITHSFTWHACLSSTPSHGMLAYPALHHMACLPDLWACLPTCPPPCGMLAHPALHHMACLPDLVACLPDLRACLPIPHFATGHASCICGHACPSPTWHACQICGHAYPTSTPPHGMLAHAAPAHMAYLPNLWACVPILPSGL